MPAVAAWLLGEVGDQKKMAGGGGTVAYAGIFTVNCWALACLAQMGLWVVAVFALDGAGWVFVGGGGAGPGLITHEAVDVDGVPYTLCVCTLDSGTALGGTSGGIAGVTTAGTASSFGVHLDLCLRPQASVLGGSSLWLGLLTKKTIVCNIME